MPAIGYGTTLLVGATTAAITATVALAGVRDTNWPPFSRDMVDITSQDSPLRMKQYLPGLREPGDLTIDLLFDAVSATDTVLRAMQSELSTRLFVMTFTQQTVSRTATFRALLVSYDGAVPYAGEMTASATFRLADVPVWV